MSDSMAVAARAGRHRSAACDAAILSTTLDVLREKGYDGLTVAAVIERAGVSSATLYRRWPAKSELVAAAVASIAPDDVDVDTGSFEGDIAAFVRNVARLIEARGNIVTILSSAKERDEELARAMREKLLQPRLRSLRTILDRAEERGEIAHPPSPEVFLSLLVGPIHYRGSVLNEPLTPAFLKHVATSTARGAMAGRG